MDQQLRLSATLNDKASPAAKRLQKTLTEIRATPGMDAAKQWMESFNKQTGEFVHSSGGVAGVIGAMGVSGLAAAASMSALVGHFKELGERTLAMQELGREVGLTASQINALNHAAQNFGIDPSKMQAGLSHLAGQMPQFIRGFGQLHDELAQRFPNLTKKLMGEGFQDQVKDLFHFLGSAELQKQPQLQKQLNEMIFGNGEFESLFAKGGDGFWKDYEEQLKKLAPITEEQIKAAQALREATRDFNDALDNLSTKAGPAIIGKMGDVLKEFTTLLDNLNRFEKWWADHSPSKKAEDVANIVTDELTLNREQMHNKLRGEGMFSPAKSADEAKQRLADYQAELSKLQASVNADKAHPLGFAARHGEDFQHIRALGEAMRALQDQLAHGFDEAKRENSSYQGGPVGMLHNASFGGFGDSSALSDGVKEGVLDAYRELMAERSAGDGAGLMKASFEVGEPGDVGGGGRGGVGGRSAPSGLSALAHGKVTGSMLSRGDDAMAYLMSLGVTKEAAAAIVGNAQQESSITGHGPAGDHGTAHGMFQWRFDRFEALKRFAAARGKPWQDEHTELAFAVEEAKRRGHAEWLHQHDIYAANQGMQRFEQYGDSPDHGNFRTRLGNARMWATRPLPDLTPKAAEVPKQQDASRIDLHIHDRGGNVKRVDSNSPRTKVHMNRWPTTASTGQDM